MGPEQLFRRRCYLNGITDQWKVDKLWQQERARLIAENPKRRGRGRRQ